MNHFIIEILNLNRFLIGLLFLWHHLAYVEFLMNHRLFIYPWILDFTCFELFAIFNFQLTLNAVENDSVRNKLKSGGLRTVWEYTSNTTSVWSTSPWLASLTMLQLFEMVRASIFFNLPKKFITRKKNSELTRM